MKDLLIREHYCYKIHTSLMEKSGSFPLNRQPPYMNYPSFLLENLYPALLWFFKNLNLPPL